MKRIALNLILLISVFVCMAEPFCRVRVYNESDGLSHRHVKQLACDRDGMIWLATWNGLNRFDGTTFTRIRPASDDEARSFSSRIGEIKLATTEGLWIRIDERIVYFDLRTYRFTDIHSRLEKKFNRTFNLSHIRPTVGGQTVLEMTDCFVTLRDNDPVETASLTKNKPLLNYNKVGNRDESLLGKYDDMTFTRKTESGAVWTISRKGEISYAPSVDAPLELVEQIDIHIPAGIIFGTYDSQGNIWLRSNGGAICVTLGELPYRTLPGVGHGRAAIIDSKGRVWLAESPGQKVLVYDDRSMARCRYLTADGRLSDSPAEFGRGVYSLAEGRDGSIWLGTKPDGLFRLRGGRLDQIKSPAISYNDVYDLQFDRNGRLWVGTLRGGVDVILNPSADSPKIVKLPDLKNYPRNAKGVRHLTPMGDSVMLASTTGGLLALSIPKDNDFSKIWMALHVSKPGRPESLSDIAVMDATVGKNGHVYVATESGGLNVLKPPYSLRDTALVFAKPLGFPDVTLGLAPDSKFVVGNTSVSFIKDDELGKTYTTSYWQDDLRFTEMTPLDLGEGRWLLGTESKVIITTFPRQERMARSRAVFTSAAIETRPDSLISAGDNKITLSTQERNITLKFASVGRLETDGVTYFVRVDGSDWLPYGQTRAISLFNLSPGDHTVEVREGEDGDPSRVDLYVTPRFYESTFAKILYVVLFLAIIGLAFYFHRYILRIKNERRETLEAYLKLLEEGKTQEAKPVQPAVETVAEPEAEPAEPEPVAPKLSDSDKEFMETLLGYIEKNISNTDVSVDDLAEATSMSRSSLNRKVKSLLGVTPAEFLRESRIQRAANLLKTTDLPIKEIAYDCGFSDLNYFGKAFKASRGSTPSAYRNQA